MSELWAAFAGAALALLAALGTRLLDHFLEKDRERSQAIWGARLQRCLEIEKDAGVLFEHLGSPRPVQPHEGPLLDAVARIELNAGAVRRDQKLTQAIRDFVHTCKTFISELGMFGAPEKRPAELAEMRTHFDVLIRELDRFLGQVGREKGTG